MVYRYIRKTNLKGKSTAPGVADFYSSYPTNFIGKKNSRVDDENTTAEQLSNLESGEEELNFD